MIFFEPAVVVTTFKARCGKMPVLSVFDDIGSYFIPDLIAFTVDLDELWVWELALIEIKRFAFIVFYDFNLIDFYGLLKVLLFFDSEISIELFLEFLWIEVSGHVFNDDAIIRNVESPLSALFNPSDFSFDPNQYKSPYHKHGNSEPRWDKVILFSIFIAASTHSTFRPQRYR